MPSAFTAFITSSTIAWTAVPVLPFLGWNDKQWMAQTF
jgi:hypothetical protein